MTAPLVMIAGGGIGGLTAALTLHQIGVRAVVFESVRALKPLGVGINLQPNAVRELYDLGLTAADLDRVGVPTREWALVGLNGKDIHAEPRGLSAGYKWPQYAVHRGKFHMLLADLVRERLGPEALRLGSRVTGYRQGDTGVTALLTHADGTTSEHDGTLLLGADGIHSALRAQMHPGQPPIHWGGVLMWRGTAQARPLRTGSSFVGLGTQRQRMVIYPISPPDPVTGLATINWIAETTLDPGANWQKTGWFREAPISDFLPLFADWKWDWFDAPALIKGSETAYENAMIDRDPIPTWVQGRVALLGDAAHAMYPTGSNGATQAIVDGRVLGAMMLRHGVTPGALAAYDTALCGPISQVVLRNRSDGPFGLLKIVDDRCGGHFTDIDTVIPPAERAAFVATYKASAGFAMEATNTAPPTIPPGARLPGDTAAAAP